MEIQRDIVEKLSARGILAYVAVTMADGTKASTAALAGLVRATPGVMVEGLRELAAMFPTLVKKEKASWICGTGINTGELQILESSRFRLLVDDLQKYWIYMNELRVPFAFNGRDGRAVQKFLSDNPSWTESDWRLALNNRKNSVLLGSASATEPFFVWIDKLVSYAAGPLDRFYKPIGGERHGKAVAIHQANRDAGNRFIDNLRSGNGHASKG